MKAGLRLGARELDQLWRYYLLLTARNPDHDLTRIIGLRAVATKHFLDCALVPTLVELPSPLLDIGAGAGFPGVVLSIMRPDLEVILAEERVRKVAFLRDLVAELTLPKARVLPIHVSHTTKLHVSGVITRALETASATLDRCKNLVTRGGKVILMKGPSVDKELRGAARKARRTFELSEDLSYVLPGTPYHRRILVYERTDQA